ncbi:hypothetical protein NP493_217g01003 [Ridgeia piscesae]|uniref:Voltage-gated hydrogen channel 1 n=1 Tax=Ridgeia piscesae TaxID=27915 RepID=A0AAD9P0J4_RIDPI|nr:hypothetical protein NP493_217g01003 [Ridgeia piscesae]
MRMEGFKKVHTGDDLERVIEKDDSNSSVTESDEGKKPPRTCREQITYIINTNKFQIGIVCFVIFACLLVICELLIDLHVFEVQDMNLAVPQVLRYMTISVLSLFVLEISIKLGVMRLDLFRHKMEVFDALIVVVTFALEIAFANHEGLMSGVGLLIVLRLWRVTKILNGIIMSVKRQAERRLARERRTREAVEQELAKFREYCAAQETEIELLQGLLKKNGIQLMTSERPVVGSTINVIAEVNEVNCEKSDCPLDVRQATESHLL